MRRKLLWVPAAPFIVAALDVALGYFLVHVVGHRGLDDTVYWGTILPWLIQAIWVVSAIACLVIVLGGIVAVLLGVFLGGPALVIHRLLNRWPADFERPARGTPEQRASRELRRPGI